MTSNDVNVGGQAVIEGVMMRSEKYISIAVRKPDGKIVLKRTEHRPWTKRNRMLRLPLLRGGVILIESLVHGIKALTWSADIAMEAENGASAESRQHTWKSNVNTIVTLTLGFAVGLLLFFWLPLVLTDWIGVESGVGFNAVDGIFRLLFFGVYIGLISLWKEIRRIYQYHGAEHKSILALENDCPLTVDGARNFSTLHPRCGTSFLLVVMVVSIIVFMFLGRPESTLERLIRLMFVPVIGGISYELLRFSSKHRNNPITRIFILPGLWLQKVTTKEPSHDQLEIGLVALRSALGEILNEEDIEHS
ncbi:DUF1385 domain-containing protein [candidate division KSB1 bacterium]